MATRIESRPGLGNVLVAARDFKCSEAVVQERPLLHVPQLKPSNLLYTPLQAYFEQHLVPPSVVLKIMAFVLASPSTQASVLRCFCPDPDMYADAAVVQQARAFATCLLQHPPAPEFADFAAGCSSLQRPAAEAASSAPSAADAEHPASPPDATTAAEAQQRMQQQHPEAFDMLTRVWLIWVLNGHSFKLGSALFEYGSKLTHTCAGANTVYRTAKGDITAVLESVDGSSSSSGGSSGSSGGLQVPACAAGSSEAGVHVALEDVPAGSVLTTNYFGMGHRRLMSTPARQRYLQDKFLFKCTCDRCTNEVDLARGIPCPACSEAFRSEDKLLQEQEALPAWHVGQALHTAATTATAAGGGGSSSSSSGGGCGYLYCDMAALLAGDATPWKCDVCGKQVANGTAELWGRFYTKSHASIETEMEGWVTRLDESMNSAPLVRDPRVLHERVLGITRLLGPRHWASWRLLLLGVELHCGALEDASLKTQLRQRRASREAELAAAAATDGAAAVGPGSSGPASAGEEPESGAVAAAAVAAVFDDAAAGAMTQLAVWVVRYCRQLWKAVGTKYGEVEAGVLLGYHFTEACQVLLQVASGEGLLPPATATGLVDAAMQLQLLVLPGLRSIMGSSYNPLAGLLGPGGLAAVGGDGAGVDAGAVAAAVRRQMEQRAADARQMMSLVQELKHLEAREAGQGERGGGGDRSLAAAAHW